MKHILGFVFIFSISQIAYAQFTQTTDSILLSGAVYDKIEMTPLSEAHFVVNNHKIGISDDEGLFSFIISKTDTIIFSYLGFQPYSITVPDSIISERFIVGIFLDKDTFSLPEVIVLPTALKIDHALNKPIKEDKNVYNARNNLRLAKHQAYTQTQSEWDADMNTKATLTRYQRNAENLGLIPPDEIIPITAAIPLAYSLIKTAVSPKNNPQFKPSPQEQEILKLHFLELKEKQK